MLHLTACDCGLTHGTLVHRSRWMRVLFSRRRLFECRSCRRIFLIRPGSTALEQRASLVTLGLLVVGAVSAMAVMQARDVSTAPPLATAVASPAAPSAIARQQHCTRTHVFREGETFESIAEAELGDPEKWQQIRGENQQLLDAPGQELTPGTALKIPVACP